MLAFRDYGISADEPMGLWFGYHTYGYLFMGQPVPPFPDWTFYGPAWHLFLAAANQMVGGPDGRMLWLLRHFLNFTLFFVGIMAFYSIARQCLRNEKFALLASVFLMLSPRIFAHSFHNPKDMPAMVFFVFAVWTMLLFLRHRSVVTMILHALCCAVLISMRMFGLIIPLLTVSFLLCDAIPHGKGNARIAGIKDAAIYGILLCVLIVAIWPVLWDANPLARFLEALLNSGSRTGGGFYFGRQISGNPWHYLPVWMAITTPLLYSAAFLTGCCVMTHDLVRAPLRTLQEKTDLVLLVWFFLPTAVLIVLHIGIFDEWRHVLFIYPAFLLIGMRGIERLFEVVDRWHLRNARMRAQILSAVIATSLTLTGYWMVTRHPYQYMYFSIPSRFVRGNFDLDYWNLGARESLQWILDHDRTPVIKVYPSARIARIASDLLPLNGWARIEWSTPDQASYILDNLRGNNYAPTLPDDRKIHAISVDGLDVLTIYRGPDTLGIYEPQHWLEDERKAGLLQ